MFKHLLVPTDGSPLSEDTVRRGIAFAAETGARITFFHSQAEPPFPIYGDGLGVDRDDLRGPERAAQAAAAQADAILGRAKAAAEAAGVSADTEAGVTDTPYIGIIAAAERNDCDIIFMASHGRRGITGLLLGSETQKVLTHSKIPVLVYR
ncbi:universal stress protein [Novispirillum sp. DQ9]|uniref:universal stress protein n=1 Tax=Novispirillum sp. DQ9 TaxID=3398612 RepID=UPI003C7B2D27